MYFLFYLTRKKIQILSNINEQVKIGSTYSLAFNLEFSGFSDSEIISIVWYTGTCNFSPKNI